MKLYTKSGDEGTTGLMYSRRVPKDHIAVEVLCGIDEIVGQCGIIRAQLDNNDLNAELVSIQERCFRLGTFFATDPADRAKLDPERSSLTLDDVTVLEEAIDRLCETFSMPTAFVHPGENVVSASCDLARVSVRRCEISVARSIATGWVDASNIAFAWLNRLSDYFYALARSLEGDQKLREKRNASVNLD